MHGLLAALNRRGLLWSSFAMLALPSHATGKKKHRKNRHKKRKKERCRAGFRTIDDCREYGMSYCNNPELGSIQQRGCVANTEECCVWSQPARGYAATCYQREIWQLEFKHCFVMD